MQSPRDATPQRSVVFMGKQRERDAEKEKERDVAFEKSPSSLSSSSLLSNETKKM